MVHEVYDSLFFSSNFLFPLEGKCHVVAKGCTGQSNDVILYRYPDHQSTASIATSWSSPPLQAGGTRFNKCSCKGFIIRGRLLSIHRRPPKSFEPFPLQPFYTTCRVSGAPFPLSGIQPPASNDTDSPYVSSSWLMTRFFVLMKFGAASTTSTRAMRP